MGSLVNRPLDSTSTTPVGRGAGICMVSWPPGPPARTMAWLTGSGHLHLFEEGGGDQDPSEYQRDLILESLAGSRLRGTNKAFLHLFSHLILPAPARWANFISQIRAPRLSCQVVCPNFQSWGSVYSHCQILEIVAAAQRRWSLTKIFSGEGRGVARAEAGDATHGLVTLSNLCQEF